LPTAIVTDAQVIRDYYAVRYHKESSMIAYGAEGRTPSPIRNGWLRATGCSRISYVLYVSRLEPERQRPSGD
jgi:hypothetical protein